MFTMEGRKGHNSVLLSTPLYPIILFGSLPLLKLDRHDPGPKRLRAETTRLIKPNRPTIR